MTLSLPLLLFTIGLLSSVTARPFSIGYRWPQQQGWEVEFEENADTATVTDNDRLADLINGML